MTTTMTLEEREAKLAARLEETIAAIKASGGDNRDSRTSDLELFATAVKAAKDFDRGPTKLSNKRHKEVMAPGYIFLQMSYIYAWGNDNAVKKMTWHIEYRYVRANKNVPRSWYAQWSAIRDHFATERKRSYNGGLSIIGTSQYGQIATRLGR